MKNSLVFFLLFMKCLNLNGQNHNYDKSGKKIESNERIILKIDTTQVKMTNNKQSGAAVAAILPVVVEQGLKIYKNILAEKEAKFIGEYSASSSKSGFWENGTTVSLPKLTLSRTLIDLENEKEASRFILKPEKSSDGIAFRYKLDSLFLNYSKAK